MLVRNVFGFDWDLTSPLEHSFDARLERLAVDRAALLATSLANQALSDDPSAHGISWLHLQVVGTPHPWQFPAQARDWLTGAIASGRVVVWCRLVTLRQLDHPQDHFPEPCRIGSAMARKDANRHTGVMEHEVPVAVFAGTGVATGLPDLTDGTCPSDNHRSESTATCLPQVTAWFNQKEVAEEYRNSTLGYVKGGGFECTMTRVRHLNAGTRLYRYVDAAEKPYGAWWFLRPLDGDPRVLAALPDYSAATVMVQARLKREVDVLYGPGAPRCSNKPGGPEQVFVARCDYLTSEGDILELIS